MYRFDTNWLLRKYRKRSYVAKHVEDELERKVLLGVHDHDHSNGELAENPSKLDYETLNTAYERIRYYELLIQLYMHAQYFRFYWLIFESEHNCHCQVPKVCSANYLPSHLLRSANTCPYFRHNKLYTLHCHCMQTHANP